MSDYDDDMLHGGFGAQIPSVEPEAQIDPSQYLLHLTQAWINERAAPDLLQYEEDSVTNLLARIEEQTATIDELDSGTETAMIISILYQTELERVKFVLRSYLRTRISKLERYCTFILADPSSRRRLSRAEVAYAENYLRATTQHYHNSFLSSLPPSVQPQDLEVFDRKLSMVSQPPLDEAVFFRVVADIGDFQISEEDTLLLQPGQIYILRYRTVRVLLQRGQIELI
ncbi:GINS complex subunit 4 [Entomortierella parvispora]|uniref:DNA replication complex GINS protein SLD5 n=1 Tax=Entomortierella parvispora TaxID=205924 RepID=A0A9P3H6A0_9FUNG|nr:GINS complex subunit 4 [Entomortierella parvispora]